MDEDGRRRKWTLLRPMSRRGAIIPLTPIGFPFNKKVLNVAYLKHSPTSVSRILPFGKAHFSPMTIRALPSLTFDPRPPSLSI